MSSWNKKSGGKAYFSTNLMVKKKEHLMLQENVKGFLATCNNGQEKFSIKDAYMILNEYADKLYGSEEPDTKLNDSAETMDEFQKEMSDMKSKDLDARRFQAVNTAVRNIVFIKTLVEDPVHLMKSIIADLEAKKERKSRFLLRLIPIEITCRARMTDIQGTAASLFEKYFKGEATTFSIIFNRRYNSEVDRMAVITLLADMICNCNENHKVDLEHAKMTVLVEILRGICCFAVISDYPKFYRFNLNSAVGIVSEDCSGKKASSDAAEGDDRIAGEKERANP